MTAIAGVLFDFGGVVVDSPFGAFAAIADRHGLPPDAVRHINSRNSDSNAWAQLERASIDAARFRELFEAEAAELGYVLDAAAILDALRDVPASQADARPEVLRAVRSCRTRGLRVGLLTNNAVPMDANPDTAWVYDEFDVVVESCRLGLRKPDPDIYRQAGQALGVALSEIVFLDDLGINLKAARALGMHTIKVTDPGAAVQELERVCSAT